MWRELLELFNEWSFAARRLASLLLTMSALGITAFAERLIRLAAWLVDYKLRDIE